MSNQTVPPERPDTCLQCGVPAGGYRLDADASGREWRIGICPQCYPPPSSEMKFWIGYFSDIEGWLQQWGDHRQALVIEGKCVIPS